MASRAKKAAQSTVNGLFGMVLIVVTFATSCAVIRGVSTERTVVVDEDSECLVRVLTPQQLATDRWWDDCD